MRAQAQAAQAKLDGSSTNVALEPYDPMRMKALLLYHYNGLTWHALNEMDYREYFGLIRELSFILEEQSPEKEKPKQQSQSELQAMLNQFPQPVPYEGTTIQLI